MIQQVPLATALGDELAAQLHLVSGMSRFITATRRIRATVVILVATVASYARIVGVVVAERLWRMPPRRLRSDGLGSIPSRSLP